MTTPTHADLHAELASLRATVQNAEIVMAALRERDALVRAENARLRAALAKYADTSNWSRGPARDDDACVWLVEGDGYDVAALALVEGGRGDA